MIPRKSSKSMRALQRARCGPGQDEPLEGCMITGLGHCWSGNNCCDSQCANQNPANLDSSAYLLNWFNSVPARAADKAKAPLADRLRAQLAHTTFSFTVAPQSNATQAN